MLKLPSTSVICLGLPNNLSHISMRANHPLLPINVFTASWSTNPHSGISSAAFCKYACADLTSGWLIAVHSASFTFSLASCGRFFITLQSMGVLPAGLLTSPALNFLPSVFPFWNLPRLSLCLSIALNRFCALAEGQSDKGKAPCVYFISRIVFLRIWSHPIVRNG